MSKDLKAQITIAADAAGVEQGVGKAKRSLADLGKSAKDSGKQAAAGIDNIGTATGRASKAIDMSIARLQLQAATIGKSATDTKLYELSLRGASQAQLATATAALRAVDAHKAQAAAAVEARLAYNSLQASAVRMGAVIATVGIAGAASIVAVARSSINAIDKFNDLSDATGASIENISALDRVSRETGGNFESMSSALIKFNSALTKTDEESQAASRVLQGLGLDVEALKKIDPAEAMRQAAVAMSQFADDGNKARGVQLLFGKSIAEAAPLLKDLAEQTSLVGSVSTSTAQQAEAFNKQIYGMQANVQDAARALSMQMVPAISELAAEMTIGMQKADGFIDALLTFGTINPFRTQVGNMQELRDQLKGLEDDRHRYTRAGSDTRAIDDAIRQANRQLDFLKTLQARRVVADSTDVGISASDVRQSRRMGIGGALPSLNVPDKPKKVPKGKTEKPPKFTGLTYDESISQAAGKLLEDSDVARAKVFADTMTKLDDLYFSAGISAELYDSAMQKLTGSTSTATSITSGFLDEQKRLAELMANTTTAQIGLQRKDMELLTKALENGSIAESDYLEAVTARLGLTATETGQVKTFADEMGLSFTSAFEDAVVGGKKFSDVLKGLGQDIVRISLRKLVTEPMGNYFTDMLKGISMSGIGGGAGLNAPGGQNFGMDLGFDIAGMRADGGPVAAGKSYIVGERRPEVFTPSQAGVISPSTAMGGATINYAPTIQIDGTADRAQSIVLVQRVVKENNRQLMEEMRRSGLYS